MVHCVVLHNFSTMALLGCFGKLPAIILLLVVSESSSLMHLLTDP